MNDPHVAALRYRLLVREGCSFVSPPPVEHARESFRARLDDGELRIEMLAHAATAEEARAVAQPFVNGWVLHAALERHRRDFWFEFITADMIDRAPTPRIVSFAVSMVATSTMTARAAVVTTNREYPPPPARFEATPLVEALFMWHQSSALDNRIAPAAAYFCLTAVKTRVRQPGPAGGRERSDQVADTLGVDRAILNELHRLSTESGDIATARKVSDKAELDRPRPPHTAQELNWIVQTIRKLALRLGEWEADPAAPLAPLAMTDLPPLM